MSLTDEERFRFDLTGFLVRPAILTADEVKDIREQIYLIKHNPESFRRNTATCRADRRACSSTTPRSWT